MSVLSIIVTLVIEHFRPITDRLSLYRLFIRYAQYVERHFNGGQNFHGIIGWSLVVLPPVIVVGVLYYLAHRIHPVLVILFNIVILYLTIGFRYFMRFAEGIMQALIDNNLEEAKKLLFQWHARATDEFSASEIARVSIEQTLISGHKQLFGVLAWFLVLGPAGCVIYRLSHILNRKWGTLDSQEFGAFGKFSARIFELIDWVPLRLTGLSFAIVGDFEDAIFCWRSQGEAWERQGQGIILASGAGALGVRLGDPLHYPMGVEFRPDLGLGDEADPDYLQSSISLVWRSLVLWLVVLLLLTFASWLGG